LGFSLDVLSVCCLFFRNNAFGSLLVLLEVLAIELLSLAWKVHPEATITADGARALDLKANAVGRVGRCWQVHVRAFAGQVGRAIIAKREQVDGTVVYLRRSHGCG
jgi:hypothetical protein